MSQINKPPAKGLIRFDTYNEDDINNNDNINNNDSLLDNECPICLEPLGDEHYSILDICFHKYHEKCISDWFGKCGMMKCPECNTINTSRIVIKLVKKKNKVDPIKPVEPIKLVDDHKSVKTISTDKNIEDSDACSRTCGCSIS